MASLSGGFEPGYGGGFERADGGGGRVLYAAGAGRDADGGGGRVLTAGCDTGGGHED